MRSYAYHFEGETQEYRSENAVNYQEFEDDVIEDMRHAVSSLMNRKLATTETGYLCLVPDMTCIGDFIVVLYGCNFPVVLRPQEGNFVYVGECYVDGIMDGEVLDAKDRGEYQEVDIILC